MQQQMAGLVRQVTGLSPRPEGSSSVHGQHRVVVGTGRARSGRVVAAAHVASQPKYCRLRGAAAVAVPETSRQQLLDQQHVRPGNTASNQLIATVRFASILAWFPGGRHACSLTEHSTS
jgi:hypothetical protein